MTTKDTKSHALKTAVGVALVFGALTILAGHSHARKTARKLAGFSGGRRSWKAVGNRLARSYSGALAKAGILPPAARKVAAISSASRIVTSISRYR